MDKDEALKQALEALEGLFGLPDKFTGGGGDVAVWRLGGSYRAQEAITSLRQAIAELESQEPVAWKLMPRDATDAMLKAMDECSTEGYDERLYAGHAASVYMAAWDALDTHPPQRTWVGLTDEEILEVSRGHYNPHQRPEISFAHAIKAKLKQKNGYAEEKNT